MNTPRSQMNIDQIRQIVAWINEHPGHCTKRSGDNPFEGKTPAKIWIRFCLNPTVVSDYKHPFDCEMSGEPVENGCTLVFSKGSYRKMRCNRALVPGKDRCAFHDHPVFSAEVRNHIYSHHQHMNDLCRFTPLHSFDSDDSEMVKSDVSTHEYVYKVLLSYDAGNILVFSFCENLYREPEHNLILSYESGTTLECVGYVPSHETAGKRENILPLTPELKTICEKRGFVCV